jgi:hypothetical protein
VSKSATITLRAAPGRAGIRALRTLLKVAGRHLNMRALNVREESKRRRRSACGCKAKQRHTEKITMDMKQYAGSRFLKLKDVESGPIRATIGEVVLGKYDKPDIIFTDGSKLSVNATNARVLNRAFGDQSEDWIGGKVELVAGETEYQGEMRESIVVKPISPVSKPDHAPVKSAKSSKASKASDMDDEITF